MILICIGIGSLTIIVFLVSPVTFKIRRQKYQVLLFFMRLDEHIIKQSCLKSTIFEDKFTSDHFTKHGNGTSTRTALDDEAQSESNDDDEFCSHDYTDYKEP